MTDVNMSVVLFTYDDTTSIELMEATVPTMEAVRSKMDDIYAIISDWAKMILEERLAKRGEELTCELIVKESTNTVFDIVLMLNGATITELPDEYISEFNKGMPTLVGELFDTLQLNFDVRFTATNYIASDMREELKRKLTGLTESYTLPQAQGWYRIAYSAVGVKNCTGLFSIVTSGENISETIMFTVGTSYAQNGDTLQQIQRTRRGTDITRIRLLVNKNNYATTYAYLDVYKASVVEEPISLDVLDGTGFTLCDEPVLVTDVPTGYTPKYLELADGGIVASKIEGLDATVTELNYSCGLTGPIQTQLDGKATTMHASENGNTYGKSTATLYGHARASADTPLVASDNPSAGLKLDEFARGDHVHPVQTSVSGNAGTATALETARTIGLTGGVTAVPVSFDGTANVNVDVTSLDATTLEGYVPVSSIPLSVIERLTVVENDTERFALTESDVQNGDTVKVQSTNMMYFVVDSTNLDNEGGYEVYTAGYAGSVEWNNILNKPSAYTPIAHKSSHSTGGTDELLPADIGAEPSFVKNTAFNKDFENSSSNIKVAGVANVGSLQTIARADHVHPEQIDVTGNSGTTTRLQTARTIGLSGGVVGTATTFDGSSNIVIPVTSVTASSLVGVVPIESIPPTALERLVVVADDTARFALTTEDVQIGDTVKVVSTNKMYFVVDVTHLDTEAGYEVYTAGAASSVPWSGVTGKPSTFTPSIHASSHGYSGDDPITPVSIGAEPTISKNTAFNKDFGNVSGTVCEGNDSRLTDSRTPTVHASTHASDGTDPITPASIGAEPTIATKNTAFNKNFGTSADTVCEGNDSRLSDSRTPVSHASTSTTYGVSTASNYGHAIASSTTPIVASVADVGTEISAFARGDHVHPAQTSVSGNAGTATALETARTIGISGGATGTATSFDGSANITIPVTELDATKLVGIIPEQSVPQTALVSVVNVADDTERFALTTNDVKKGDTVKVASTSLMYFVVDTTHLSTDAGYEVYTSGAAQSVPWSGITGKPSTFTPSTHASTHASDGTDPITPASIGAEPTIATKNTAFNKNFGTASDTVCEGNDSRLSNSRTPTSHASTHGSSGADPITPSSIGAEPAFTKNGAFNKNFGTAAGTVCEGNDSRLSNSRTPTSHATTATTYGVSTAANYGHAMASSTTPKVAGSAAVGSETAKFARGDHVHPVQTSVSGNAGTATTLATARTIAIGTGATGTATSFNGSANITIPITALNPSYLSSAVAVGKGGTGATTAAAARTNLGVNQILYGTSAPSSSLGANGDIYIYYSS